MQVHKNPNISGASGSLLKWRISSAFHISAAGSFFSSWYGTEITWINILHHIKLFSKAVT